IKGSQAYLTVSGNTGKDETQVMKNVAEGMSVDVDIDAATEFIFGDFQKWVISGIVHLIYILYAFKMQRLVEAT
ncbi:MAG: hypothetical protein ACUVQV_07365, partial [Dissulfurimicrobium sp.]|uniref:hypothetical protein n=1 Tax=Dissulfurimicrobium sp. TaxID=2022436 RepID=UPI0040492D53